MDMETANKLALARANANAYKADAEGLLSALQQKRKQVKQQQAEIDELVDMLDEMLYSNSTKYREKAEALIAKHRGEE